MNMGGGILFRTVARAAGSTTPAASTAFCSGCTSQVTRPSSLRTTCRTCHHTALSQQATSPANPVEFEDWEFAEEPVLESANRPLSGPNADGRLLFSPTPSSPCHSSACIADDSMSSDNQFWHVFGLPPSFDEANAATSELQAALFSYHNSATDEIKSISSSSMSLGYEGAFSQSTSDHKDSDSEQEPHCGGWVEPQLVVPDRGMVQVAKGPVHEAFQLLQSDPNVKGAVISIVSDPDVWHAMMKNERVQELKRIFQNCQGKDEMEFSSMQEHQPSNDDKHHYLGGVSFLLRSIIGMSRQVVCQVQDDISKIILSIFSLLTGPKRPSEKDEDPFDKTMRSSVMLAVLVVTVVLMKRVQV